MSFISSIILETKGKRKHLISNLKAGDPKSYDFVLESLTGTSDIFVLSGTLYGTFDHGFTINAYKLYFLSENYCRME